MNKKIDFLYKSITVVILSWVVVNAFIYMQQPNMVFYPFKKIESTPKDWGLDYKQVNIKLREGDTISGWYFPHPQAVKTVLFFHGNGGNISHRGDSIYVFHKLKLNVLIIDYPGYGESSGQPSENGLYQSANAAWQYLVSDKQVKPKDIIIFGRSLGGAVAVDLATRVEAAGLILESTFSSVSDIAKIAFPIMSNFIYLRYSFDSLSKIHRVKSPVLLIHSPDDEVIPFELGQKLFAAIQSEKEFLQIEGGHNDGFMQSIQSYMYVLRIFSQSL